MALLKTDSKEALRITCIFAGILTFFFLIDFGCIRLAEKKWTKGLQQAVETMLEEKQPDKWKVTKPVRILSPFSTSAALYELQDKNSAEKEYAVIIRTTTLFGPYPAVFLYKKNSGAEFLGYTCVSGRVKRILEENTTNPLLAYWTQKIEKITADSLPKPQ